MAKICIDVRCLMEGRKTGVEEYTLGLLLNLLEADRDNDYVLFFSSWKKPAFDFSIFEKYSNVTVKKIKIPNKLFNFFFWYFSWPKIDKLVGGVDVIFFPNIIFGAVSKEVKMITTIHDLSFERYPEYFSWKRRFWHIFINSKKICQRADQIIAVSNSSQNDIISLYGVEKEKVKMIHSAVSEKFKIIDRNDEKLIKIKNKYSLPFKFILYLGTVEPRKNITGIIRAYSNLQSFARETKNFELAKYKLVIAGSNGWLNEDIFKEIKKSKFKKDIILPGFIQDADKVYVYNLASLFVYPSFFEGFGFPPLEAMKCGVPVIASNNSSLPEICGVNSILINPDKPGEISQAMQQILLDRVLREKLIKVGLEKAKEFNWKKTTQKTIKLFN
ncbi:MAG: glycosyltransferase family 1 protein [Candidatus Moraniibacteriota bacterium]